MGGRGRGRREGWGRLGPLLGGVELWWVPAGSARPQLHVRPKVSDGGHDGRSSAPGLITRGFPRGGAGVPFRTRREGNLGRHTHRRPRAGLALRGRRSPDVTSSAPDCVMRQPVCEVAGPPQGGPEDTHSQHRCRPSFSQPLFLLTFLI